MILADVGVRQYSMASKLENYIEEDRTLDCDEREIAARALQRMDESEQVEIDAAWEETVARRLDDLKSGLSRR